MTAIRLRESESLLIPLLEAGKTRDEIVRFFYPQLKPRYEYKCNQCYLKNRRTKSCENVIKFRYVESHQREKCDEGHPFTQKPVYTSVFTASKMNWFKKERQFGTLLQKKLVTEDGPKKPLRLNFNQAFRRVIFDIDYLKEQFWTCTNCNQKYRLTEPQKCSTCGETKFATAIEALNGYSWSFQTVRTSAKKFRVQLFSIENLSPIIYLDPNKPLQFSFRGFINISLALLYLANLRSYVEQFKKRDDLPTKYKIYSSLICLALYKLRRDKMRIDEPWEKFRDAYIEAEEQVMHNSAAFLVSMDRFEKGNFFAAVDLYLSALLGGFNVEYHFWRGSRRSSLSLSGGVEFPIQVKQVREALAKHDNEAKILQEQNILPPRLFEEEYIYLRSDTSSVIDFIPIIQNRLELFS